MFHTILRKISLVVIAVVLAFVSLWPTVIPAQAQSDNINLNLHANAFQGGLYVMADYKAVINNAYLKLSITTSRPITYNNMGSDVCTQAIKPFITGTQNFVFEGAVTNKCDSNNIGMGFVYQDGDAPVDIEVTFQYNNDVYFKKFYFGKQPIELSVYPTSGRVGEVFDVAVVIDKLRGQTIAALSTRVMFNYEMYELVGYYHGSTMPNADVNLVPNRDGDVNLNILSTANEPLTANGIVVFLRFKGLKAGSAPVVLLNPTFEVPLGADQPTIHSISGEVGVEDYVVLNGQITYADTKVTVPNAVVTLNQTPSISTTTDGSGNYMFKLSRNSFASPIYTKVGEVNGAVSAFDATLAERCAIGLPKLGYSGECVVEVIDVTGDGKITQLDAWYILRYAAGYSDPTLAGTWKFEPGNAYLPSLTKDTTQNQKAFIIGDVSMNWGSSQVVTASVPAITLTATTRQVVVKVEGASFYSLHFDVFGPVNVNDVKADGFNVISNANGVYLESKEAHTSAEILIDVETSVGNEIMLQDFTFDENESLGMVGSTTVEQHDVLLSFLPTVSNQ